MRLVKLEEVRPGVKVAKDVTDLRGNLLFKAGTEITPDLLIRCKQRGIAHLFVEDAAGRGAAGHTGARKPPEEIAAEIDAVFAGHEANPVMTALRDAAKSHLTSRAKLP